METYDIDTVDKQTDYMNKEIEKLEQALDLACQEYVELLEWTSHYLFVSQSADQPPCPILKDIGACIHKDRSCIGCIKDHFLKEAENES